MAQLKKSKIITQILEVEIGNDKNDSKDFIRKVLYSIDKNFNEDFFKFTIDKGYSTKSTPIIKADYLNAMLEAVSYYLILSINFMNIFINAKSQFGLKIKSAIY